jgi:hypothetical protein
MKKMLLVLALLFVSLSVAIAAPTYPFSNPTYIPTAVSAPVAYTAPGTYIFTANGISTLSMRITGTCTSLSGVLQGTNDDTNWSSLTLHPVTASATTTTPVVAVAAVGFWRASVAGFKSVRLNITALTATCTVAMAGTQAYGLME